MKGTLEILIGPSGSGKSTYAHKRWLSDPVATVIVNRDKIRELLFGYTEATIKDYYEGNIGDYEKEVTKYENLIIKKGLTDGKHVIVDATHLKLKYIRRFGEFNVNTKLTIFDSVDKESCVARCTNRARYVSPDIIYKQFTELENLKKELKFADLHCYMNIEGEFKLVLREHPVFKGYYGGSDGNIYSIKKKTGGDVTIDGKIYKKLNGAKGGTNNYISVVVADKSVQNKKYQSKMVHKLIYECFYGSVKSNVRLTVSHLDGNTRNNKPNNLKGETYSENFKRKIEHGTHDRLSNNSRSLLNSDQIDIVSKLLGSKLLTHDEIAGLFSVSRLYISKLKHKLNKYEK